MKKAHEHMSENSLINPIILEKTNPAHLYYEFQLLEYNGLFRLLKVEPEGGE